MKQTIIRKRRRAGFSLIDPLVGVLAFAVVIVGALNFWRLAEYKCDLLPADGAEFRSGFLLHPVDPVTGAYKGIYPFTVITAITVTNAGTPAEQKQIVLTLTCSTNPDPLATNIPQETIRTNALTRAKT
jgi:hypothetical protein